MSLPGGSRNTGNGVMRKKQSEYPVCHPERKYRALKMCSPCYSTYYQKKTGYDWAKQNPEKRRVSERRRYQQNREILAERQRRFWNALSPEERKLRTLRNNHKYADDSDFEKFLVETKCSICRREVPLVLDHDHKRSKYRGALCGSCNKGLGHFRDSPELLREAAGYLEKE